jgi:hypothetical protein
MSKWGRQLLLALATCLARQRRDLHAKMESGLQLSGHCTKVPTYERANQQ